MPANPPSSAVNRPAGWADVLPNWAAGPACVWSPLRIRRRWLELVDAGDRRREDRGHRDRRRGLRAFGNAPAMLLVWCHRLWYFLLSRDRPGSAAVEMEGTAR